MSFHQNLLLTLGVILTISAHTQTIPSQQEDTIQHSQSTSPKYLDIVSSKANQLNSKLDKKSEKALQQLMKLEERMKKKMNGVDSLKAKETFGNAEQKYKALEQRLQGKLSGPYISSVDTMITSIKFLQQNPQLLSQSREAQQKLKDALSKVNGMENQFQKAEEIGKFLRERKEFLKSQLSKFGFAKELKKISKQAYFYQQQVEEYKTVLKDHRKAERKALDLLSKSKLFQKFMRKESILASLFQLPGDPNDPVAPVSLAGLQMRVQVNGLIQQQIAGGGPSAQQQFSQNLQAAQSQLNEIKKKVNQLGNGNSDAEIPEGFKANPQKAKSFRKKWELGVNIQSNRANRIMPVSSDLGISAGFKPNNWFTGGVGLAGRIGWGRDIRHIAVSYSGISLRSFAEFKLKPKGSFHAVAGYEWNYYPEIRAIEQLKDKSMWRPAGLVGLSKVVSLKTKFFKKTKLLLMWNFLSRQAPEASIVFRVGYHF